VPDENYDRSSADAFQDDDLLKKFDKNFNATGKNYGKVGPDRTIDDVMKRRQTGGTSFYPGMWFQDLFNYDFRRTEQCIILMPRRKRDQLLPYNTGVLAQHHREDAHDSTLTKWYEEHGRHEIFAAARK